MSDEHKERLTVTGAGLISDSDFQIVRKSYVKVGRYSVTTSYREGLSVNTDFI